MGKRPCVYIPPEFSGSVVLLVPLELIFAFFLEFSWWWRWIVGVAFLDLGVLLQFPWMEVGISLSIYHLNLAMV